VHGYSSAGYDVAPGGFFAVAPDVRAGAFEGSFGGVSLSPGVHYVIVERDAVHVTVRQPVGADSEIAVDPPAAWSPGRTLIAAALAADGTQVGTVGGRLQNGRFVFSYSDTMNGRGVAAYRITAGG
jgi:hypothetical protein